MSFASEVGLGRGFGRPTALLKTGRPSRRPTVRPSLDQSNKQSACTKTALPNGRHRNGPRVPSAVEAADSGIERSTASGIHPKNPRPSNARHSPDQTLQRPVLPPCAPEPKSAETSLNTASRYQPFTCAAFHSTDANAACRAACHPVASRWRHSRCAVVMTTPYDVIEQTIDKVRGFRT